MTFEPVDELDAEVVFRFDCVLSFLDASHVLFTDLSRIHEGKELCGCDSIDHLRNL